MVMVTMDRAGTVPALEADESGSTVPMAPVQPTRDDRQRDGRFDRPSRWSPLSGDELLARLRTTGRRRPAADPQLSQRIRAELERGLAWDPPPAPDPAPILVVTKDRLSRALSCVVHREPEGFGDRAPTSALACGALIDVLFRQLVTLGSIGDPMNDALAALSVDDRQRSLVEWIGRLANTDRSELVTEVERQADGLRHRWPRLEPAWLPRTQQSLRSPLGDGAVELSARVDLAIGRPATDEASVAIVEVKSGVRRAQHRADLHFYALIETLRSTAPPFVVATYYTRTGELDVEPVTEDLLSSAVRRTLVGIRSIRDGSLGEPAAQPTSRWCSRCCDGHDGAIEGWPLSTSCGVPTSGQGR